MANLPRTPDSPLPAQLRLALDEAGMTQEALAREIGITHRQVQKYVAGDAEPHGRRLVAIAAALGKKPEWFYDEPKEIAA